MTSNVLQITLGMILAACHLHAGDQGYSMNNLPKPLKPPTTLDKDADGTCLTWSEYWAPRGAEQVLKDLVSDDGKNPYNNGRGWFDCSFKFQVNRVVTDDANLDAQGFLINPQALIAQGVIAPTITVEFAAIEYLTGNGVVKTWLGNRLTANYKVVSVNGKKYWSEPPTGPISGWDWHFPLNQFTTVKLQIPVEMVKFPRRAALGASPLMENRIEVTTDMWGNTWAIPAIKLAWMKTSVKAMAPVMLVHGTNGNPDTWNVPDKPDERANFNQFYRDNYFLYFSDIALTPNGGIDANGQELSAAITKRLASVGAKVCHIIAHSKGGIDSRSFIYNHYYKKRLNENLNLPNHFEVLSLYTLDTPHRGTVLSDIVWNSRYKAGLGAITMWSDIQKLMDWDLGIVHLNINPFNGDSKALAPSGNALAAQTTENMKEWNKYHKFDMAHANTGGRPIKFYNTAGDADWNVRNLSIDATERDFSGYPFDFLATSAYRMLYWAKQVQVQTVQRLDGFNTPYDVTELFVPPDQGGAEWNDIVVTASSALYDGGTLFHGNAVSFNGITMSNHSAIKTYDMADAIMRQIQSDLPLDTP